MRGGIGDGKINRDIRQEFWFWQLRKMCLKIRTGMKHQPVSSGLKFRCRQYRAVCAAVCVGCGGSDQLRAVFMNAEQADRKTSGRNPSCCIQNMCCQKPCCHCFISLFADRYCFLLNCFSELVSIFFLIDGPRSVSILSGAKNSMWLDRDRPEKNDLLSA